LPDGPSARTRISRNHQITIPQGPFRAAGLGVGDPLRIKADGDGRLLVWRIEAPVGSSD
jgi:bifunctional DNA-binding transcriptional regulator/antitoxin component of YhaV-PrlF toxin-antitoxin module